MRAKRVMTLYGGFLLAFFVVLCRLYLLATNSLYAGRARQQTITTLQLGSSRGNFYDCDGKLLTGAEVEYYALCIPGEESYTRLFDLVDYETQSYLYQMRNSAQPFLIRVNSDLTGQGIFTWQSSRRYAQTAICTHLLGYLNADGHGVTGLEAAFDELLAEDRPTAYVQCVTNGQGSLMDETEPVLQTTESQTEQKGVKLTISAALQRACEGIAAKTMTSGCILVLETATAKVRACVSYPFYDPENISKSIRADDGSLLNRAFSAYSVGSVFKPVVAAAALQQGIGWFSMECKGYEDVDGQIFRCAGGIAHGQVDLKTALQNSCNCYFIRLGEMLGAQKLLQAAANFGFGQPVYLAGGIKAAAGNLPSTADLNSSGQRANFSFGQGRLLATPVQLAGMMNTIAAGGIYRTPSFIEAVVDETTGQTLQTLYQPTERTVLSRNKAQALQIMLAAVVQQGTGSGAQPVYTTSAGKTGTAQTGRFDETGQELMDLWFAGFCPQTQPRYTIVVMQDDQTDAAFTSAEIFSRVCDALVDLGYLPAEPLQSSLPPATSNSTQNG